MFFPLLLSIPPLHWIFCCSIFSMRSIWKIFMLLPFIMNATKAAIFNARFQQMKLFPFELVNEKRPSIFSARGFRWENSVQTTTHCISTEEGWIVMPNGNGIDGWKRAMQKKIETRARESSRWFNETNGDVKFPLHQFHISALITITKCDELTPIDIQFRVWVAFHGFSLPFKTIHFTFYSTCDPVIWYIPPSVQYFMKQRVQEIGPMLRFMHCQKSNHTLVITVPRTIHQLWCDIVSTKIALMRYDFYVNNLIKIPFQ